MDGLCLQCRRSFHEECTDPQEDKCCCPDEQVTFSTVKMPLGDREVGISAGRKEAARFFPIDTTAPCEWRGLANAGGGKFPIVGCIEGNQKARHHGPIKRTTENYRHNIHLICTPCHNWWHAKNDKHYNEQEYSMLPHKPRVATEEEIAERYGTVLVKDDIDQNAIDIEEQESN